MGIVVNLTDGELPEGVEVYGQADWSKGVINLLVRRGMDRRRVGALAATIAMQLSLMWPVLTEGR